MKRDANYFVIGLFVLAAMLLLISAVVVVGSGAFFRESHKYVSFFEGSVKGLKEGGAVLFRGVRVGEVKQVLLQVDHEEEQVRIPVVFEISPDAVVEVGMRPEQEGQVIRRMIAQGLRAQLELESIVTGILAVNLNFHPESESVLVGKLPGMVEIPAIPSTLQEITDAFGDIPIKELVMDLRKMAGQASKLLSSEETQSLPADIRAAVSELKRSLASANELVADGRSLLDSVSNKVDPISEDAVAFFRESRITAEKARSSFDELEAILDEDSPARYELRELIRELRAAAIEVKELAELLEREPEALLRGRAS